MGLCAAVFAGSALADPGNGNGNGNGGTPPGQEKKAEQPVPAPVAATAAAPTPAPQAAAPGQAKKAEKDPAKPAPAPAQKPKPAKAERKAEQAERKADRAATPSRSQGRSAEAHHHVIICHRTGSESNPYVVINIPWTAWSEAHSPDTGAHPDLNGRHDIMLKDPASRPGSKDGFTKASCGTAAAPPSPAHRPVDVCPNIAGMQATVPAGLVKDAHGNCVVQPRQHTDVCPNIEGMQTIVPAGMVKDAHGNCVAQAASVTSVATTTAATVQQLETKSHSAEVKTAESTKVAATAKTKSEAPATEVLGVATPVKKAAKKQPASGVLGAVASAPKAVAQTATSGTLPFTGLPLWIAVLFGGGLLVAGFALRRAAQH